MLTVVIIGGVLGIGNKSPKPGWVAVGGMSLLTVIMCLNIIKDTPTARTYGEAVDDRIEYLCTLRDKGQQGTVIVEPLPIPYTEDPTFHIALVR